MIATPLRFISFEGTEGSGKSTQIALLKARLEARGDNVICVREPGGTPLGEALREILKFSPVGKGICPEAELLLFEASRAELVDKVIAPALRNSAWVLSDRFTDSTRVYQGTARCLSEDFIDKVNAFASKSGSLLPSATLFLDITYEESQARIRARTGQESAGTDRFEAESRHFFDKVIAGYQIIARNEPGRFRRIEASRPKDVVSEEIWKEVTSAFQL